MKHLIRWLSVAALMAANIVVAASDTATPVKGPADQELKPAQLGATARVYTFGKLLLASQPGIEDFAQAKKDGVKTVINLRHAQENKDFSEQQVVEAQGMRYVNVPFEGANELNDAVFDSVRAQLKSADQPALLHCSSANRVGAVWLAFRVLDAGLSTEAALAEAKTVGLRSPELEKKALDYIKNHR